MKKLALTVIAFLTLTLAAFSQSQFSGGAGRIVVVGAAPSSCQTGYIYLDVINKVQYFGDSTGACNTGAGGGSGTVTSVGLTLPNIITVTNSPVTVTGTLTGTLATQTANTIFSGPTSGIAATPAFRALVGADLPNPSASTLGGVESIVQTTNNWVQYIDTSGVPHLAQPAFTDLSGTAASAQLPAATTSNAGAVTISGNTTKACTVTGTLTNGNLVSFDVNSNCVDAGVVAANAVTTTGTLTSGQVIIGGGTKVLSALAAGSQYNVLTMGASTPAWGQVNLAQSGAVTGTLGHANGGTDATTLAAAFINLAPAATSAGSIIYCSHITGGLCDTWTFLGGNSSGTNYLSENGSGVPSWASGTSTAAWNAITNPGGALTLSMGSNASTFNYASALAAAIAYLNTTAATVTVSQSSPVIKLGGRYWSGSDAADFWTLQDVVANGLNAASTLTFAHTGTSGTAAILIPTLQLTNPLGLAYGGTNVDLSAGGGAVNTTGKFVLKQDASQVITSAALIAADLPNAESIANCATANALAIYTANYVTGCGSADFTYATHTLLGAATAILDMHSANSVLLPGSLSTGLVRVTTSTGAITSAELSGDVTTSGSNAVTVTKINGTAFSGTNGNLVSFGAANIPADSSVVAANVATASSNFTNGGLIYAGGANKTLVSNANFTSNTTTITAGASGVLDLSSASATAGFKIPSAAGASPTTAGVFSYNSTANVPVYGNGTTTKTVVGAATSTTATQALFATATAGAPAFRAIATGDLPTIPVAGGGTNATTAAAALVNLFPTGTQIGDIIYCSAYSSGCTAWTALAGNNAGTKYLSESSTGVPSWVSGTSAALSTLTAATASNTLANGNFPQTWNWAQTTASQTGIAFGETSAATGGVGNQYLASFTTLAGSTSVPVKIISSLTGTQTLPTLSIAPTWNTTGVVDAAILVNVTNTASGAGSKLLDLQVTGSSVASIDSAGNLTISGTMASAGSVGIADFTEGTCTTGSASIDRLCASSTSHRLLEFDAGGAGVQLVHSGADINTSDQVTVTHLASALVVAQGGTGTVTNTANGVIYGNGTSPVGATAAGINDQVFMGNTGAAPGWVNVTNCGDSSHALAYSTSSHAWSCQAITATASPAGSDTQIQYNNTGSLGAGAFLTTNKTDTVTIGVASTTTGKLALIGSGGAGSTVLQPSSSASGTITFPAVTGTSAVTTGSLTTGHFSTFDSSGRLVDSTTLPSGTSAVSLNGTFYASGQAGANAGAKIAAAITALGSNGGKVIGDFFGAQTIASTITIPPGVTVELYPAVYTCSATCFIINEAAGLIGFNSGPDQKGTVLTLANSVNADVVQIVATGGTTDYAHGTIFSNILISGNKANQTAGSCVHVWQLAEAASINHIYAAGCKDDGFRFEGITTGTFDLTALSAFTNGGYGFNLAGVATSMRFVGMGGDSNALGGFFFKGLTLQGPSTIAIEGCKWEGTGTDPTFTLDGTYNGVGLSIIGCSTTATTTNFIKYQNNTATKPPSIVLQAITFPAQTVTNLYNDVANTYVVTVASVDSGNTGVIPFWEIDPFHPASISKPAFPAANVALSNGLNSNICLISGGVEYTSTMRITGPTAAFSIGGLSCQTPVNGQLETIFNTTTQPMTIVNEDTSSTAARRITTQTGANITLPSLGVASFLYSGADSRWQLVSTNTIPVAPVLGTDNVTAGSLQIANGSAAAHTIINSAATTSNTFTFPATVPTTGHLLDCTTSSTTCTIHDSGVVTANVVNASSPGAGVAHFAGSTQTVTSSTIATADIAANAVTGAKLSTALNNHSCEVIWGGTGTSNVLQSGDDAIANNSCFNKTGATETITAVYCMADVASNTVTINPTFGADGTGTTILSGALTCGSSYAYSSTGTVSNGALTDGTGIRPVMGGTLNAHSIHMLVIYTLP